TTPAGGFDDPWLGYPGGNPFPTVFNANTPFVRGGLFNKTPYDIENTDAESWNLGVQHQIANKRVISTKYKGSTTVHLGHKTSSIPVFTITTVQIRACCRTAQPSPALVGSVRRLRILQRAESLRSRIRKKDRTSRCCPISTQAAR